MADADAAPCVGDRNHFAEHGRSVISPSEIVDDGAAEQRDAARQVLMLPVPVALDVADGDTAALGACEAPHRGGADSVRRVVEITLRRFEVAAPGSRSGRHGRHGTRRHIGVPHRFLTFQRGNNLLRVRARLRHHLHKTALDEIGIHSPLRKPRRLRLGRQRCGDLDTGSDRVRGQLKLRTHGLDVEFRENLVEGIRLRFGGGRRGKSLGAERNRRLIAKFDHDIIGNIRIISCGRYEAGFGFGRAGRSGFRCFPCLPCFLCCHRNSPSK